MKSKELLRFAIALHLLCISSVFGLDWPKNVGLPDDCGGGYQIPADDGCYITGSHDRFGKPKLALYCNGVFSTFVTESVAINALRNRPGDRDPNGDDRCNPFAYQDSDSDGWSDLSEFDSGTDPNNANDHPPDLPKEPDDPYDPDDPTDPTNPSDPNNPDDPSNPGGTDGGGTGGGGDGGGDTGGGGGGGDMGGGSSGGGEGDDGDGGGGDGDGGAPGEGNEPGSGDNGGGSGDEGGNDNNGGGDGNGDTGGDDGDGNDTGGKDEPPTDPNELMRGIYSYLDRLIKAVYDTDANSSVQGLEDSLEGMSFDDFLNMGKEQSKTAQSIDSKLDSTLEIQHGMKDSILDQYEATKEMGTFIRDLINQDEKFMNDLFAQLDANASKDRSESIDKSLTKVTEQLSGQGEIVSATQSVGGRVKDLTAETERQTNAVHAVNESINRLTDAVRQQQAPQVDIEFDTSGIISNQTKAHSLWSKMQADSEAFYNRIIGLTEAQLKTGTDISTGFTAFGTDFEGLIALLEQQKREQAAQAAAQQKLQEEQAAIQQKIQEQQEEFFTLISEEQAREWWPEDFEDTILEASQSNLDILNDVNDNIKTQAESLARIDELVDGIDLVNVNLADDAQFKLGMKQAMESYQEELNQTMTGLRETQLEILAAVKDIAVDRIMQQHQELADRALQQEKELALLHGNKLDEVVAGVSAVDNHLAQVNATLEKILDKTGTVVGGGGGADGEGEEESGSPWSAPDVDWEKPTKPDELAFALDGGTVEADLTSTLNDMGLSLDRLSNFSPKRFTVSYRLPVGGTWNNLRWEQRTFELDNPAPEAGSFFSDIKAFMYGIASAAVSLLFVMRTWRLIGGI